LVEESLLEVHQYLPGRVAGASGAEDAVLQPDLVLDVVEADGGAAGLLGLLHGGGGGGGGVAGGSGSRPAVGGVAHVAQHGDVHVAQILNHFPHHHLNPVNRSIKLFQSYSSIRKTAIKSAHQGRQHNKSNVLKKHYTYLIRSKLNKY